MASPAWLPTIQSSAPARPHKMELASTTQNIQLFHYSPLRTTRSIRLISFPRDESSDNALLCSIHQFPLEEAPPYAALSYEWKGEEPQVPLHCDDGSIILVTSNCYSALIRLARQQKVSNFWVDAISINQRDVEERNAQVSFMFDIYKQSSITYVWLGEADSNSAQAMELLRKAGHIAPQSTSEGCLREEHLSALMLDTGRSSRNKVIKSRLQRAY